MFDWQQLLLSQYNDPKSGEYGLLENPYGGYSTEISATVNDPRINNGMPTVLPSLVRGVNANERMKAFTDSYQGMSHQDYEAMILRALQRGVPQGYPSNLQADSMAAWRSMMKGAGLFGE